MGWGVKSDGVGSTDKQHLPPTPSLPTPSPPRSEAPLRSLHSRSCARGLPRTPRQGGGRLTVIYAVGCTGALAKRPPPGRLSSQAVFARRHGPAAPFNSESQSHSLQGGSRVHSAPRVISPPVPRPRRRARRLCL